MNEYEERLPGEIPQYETRAEAEATVDKRKRYEQILEVMDDYPKGITAKEIAVRMFIRKYIPDKDRNHVSPRLTELMDKGIVEPVGKKICEYTGKKVTRWQRVEVASDA